MDARGSPLERMLQTLVSITKPTLDPLFAAFGAGQHQIAIAYAGPPGHAPRPHIAPIQRHDGDASPSGKIGRHFHEITYSDAGVSNPLKDKNARVSSRGHFSPMLGATITACLDGVRAGPFRTAA
jgi:hypothetical protein